MLTEPNKNHGAFKLRFPLVKHQMTYLDKVINDKPYLRQNSWLPIKRFIKMFIQKLILFRKLKDRYLLKLNMLGDMFHFAYVKLIFIIPSVTL